MPKPYAHPIDLIPKTYAPQQRLWPKHHKQMCALQHTFRVAYDVFDPPVSADLVLVIVEFWITDIALEEAVEQVDTDVSPLRGDDRQNGKDHDCHQQTGHVRGHLDRRIEHRTKHDVAERHDHEHKKRQRSKYGRQANRELEKVRHERSL